MIFVDTGGWFAAFVPTDPQHAVADDWYQRNTERLVTTDYVIDEFLTLMKQRGHYRRALTLGERLLNGTLCDVVRVTPDDLHQAWAVYSKFQDKDWSFTDCVSRVVMERLGINTAFAFDEHFRQFGTATVVP